MSYWMKGDCPAQHAQLVQQSGVSKLRNTSVSSTGGNSGRRLKLSHPHSAELFLGADCRIPSLESLQSQYGAFSAQSGWKVAFLMRRISTVYGTYCEIFHIPAVRSSMACQDCQRIHMSNIRPPGQISRMRQPRRSFIVPRRN